MKQPKKELIQGIVDLFEDYEESYVPGEWESFSKDKKKKYPFFGTWIKIAAVLLLIVSVLPLSNLIKNEEVTRVTIKKNTKKERGSSAIPAQPSLPFAAPENTARVKSRPIIDAGLTNFKAPEVSLKEITATVQPDQVQPRFQEVGAVSRPSDDHAIALRDTARLSQAEKISTLDFLLAESRNPAKKEAKKSNSSKWDFGIEVSPTMTHSTVNMGGGITTAYRLSEKFSVSSGISLLQLQSGIDIPVSPVSGMAFSSLSDKQLLAVDANIKAIDIPIAIVYKLNKNFYTSAGISYFNVVSEKRNNTYTQTTQVSQTVTNPETGLMNDSRAIVTQTVEEQAPETLLKGNSYIGFFNFSIGRRQHLFNKYNILIEPFIKVPVGKLSSQELKLMNSGLKFQVSF